MSDNTKWQIDPEQVNETVNNLRTWAGRDKKINISLEDIEEELFEILVVEEDIYHTGT